MVVSAHCPVPHDNPIFWRYGAEDRFETRYLGFEQDDLGELAQSMASRAVEKESHV